jgi:hypothetical protein
LFPKEQSIYPIADEEVWVMLFEPAATLNTGMSSVKNKA